MKKTNRIVLMTATAVLAVSLAACGGSGNQPLAPGSNLENNQNDPGNQPEEVTTIEGVGIYKGQMDSNSIEIETEDGPQAFRLAEGMDELLADLEDDAPVAYTYEEHPIEGDDSLTQLVLTKLERADDATDGAGSSNNEDATDELPATKTLTVTVEGMEEEREAQLETADGYALYVLDVLEFDAAENKLTMSTDEALYAVITQLPSDYNTDHLRLQAEEKLAEIGEVQELEGDQAMADAVLHLSAVNEERASQYIVKEIDGQGYIFEMETVPSEASEGFEPAVNATLDSLVNQ